MKCFKSENIDGKQGDVVRPEYMLSGRRGVGIHDSTRLSCVDRDVLYIISLHTSKMPKRAASLSSVGPTVI